VTKKVKLMASCTLTEDRCLTKNKYMGQVHFIVPAAVMMREKREDNWIKSTSTWIVKSIQWRPETWINEHNYRTHPAREDRHQYQIYPQRTRLAEWTSNGAGFHPYWWKSFLEFKNLKLFNNLNVQPSKRRTGSGKSLSQWRIKNAGGK
jgi:hypothetical protein